MSKADTPVCTLCAHVSRLKLKQKNARMNPMEFFGQVFMVFRL